MKKPSSKKSAKNLPKQVTVAQVNKLKVAGIVLLVLIVACLIFKNWVRNSVYPSTVLLFRGNSVQSEVNKNLDELGQPFQALGYSTTKTIKSCNTIASKGISATIECEYSVSAYKELSANDMKLPNFANHGQSIQNTLNKHGWDGTYSDSGEFTSLHKLTSNLSNGIDYTPDAAYSKMGNITCIFDSNTAFSKPKPSAMASNFSCFKLFKVFGGVYVPTTPKIQ